MEEQEQEEQQAQSEAGIFKHFDPNTSVAPHTPHTHAAIPPLTANTKMSLPIFYKCCQSCGKFMVFRTDSSENAIDVHET